MATRQQPNLTMDEEETNGSTQHFALAFAVAAALQQNGDLCWEDRDSVNAATAAAAVAATNTVHPPSLTPSLITAATTAARSSLPPTHSEGMKRSSEWSADMTVPSMGGIMIEHSSTNSRDQVAHHDDSFSDEASNSVSRHSKSRDGGEEDEMDAEKRLARSRERNREHARKTRLRKKAQLEALQSKVKGLEAERQVLKQSIEECSIASILLGLSSSTDDSSEKADPSDVAQKMLLDTSTDDQEFGEDSSSTTSAKVAILAGGKRKRLVSEVVAAAKENGTSNTPAQQHHPLTMNIDGEITVIGGGKSHINWKTGIYHDDCGSQKQLTAEQLENLRRERNRMHAKMTRDRKKCFIATIEKTIEGLEKENKRMRDVLARVASLSNTTGQTMVTPTTSPELRANESPRLAPAVTACENEEATTSAYPEDKYTGVYSADSHEISDSRQDENLPRMNQTPLKKRVKHGFSLDH